MFINPVNWWIKLDLIHISSYHLLNWFEIEYLMQQLFDIHIGTSVI